MPTILLVDNEPDILMVFRMALEWRGYRVLESANGEIALQKAGRTLPDLVVTDCNMPLMDGVELCRRLKRYPALAQIPVIMISALPPEHQKQTLWNAFFLKPVDLDAFESTVGLLLLSRPSRETMPPVFSDRAISRWQPVSSKCLP
ncbi:response regulator [Paraburkholderia dipogonis]|jgi:CheY-like chemotaxis protein|uniref:response regulator n=1 Tax=Paraburkholderia dipogonis TaxID=1211383 RepID=UPI0038B92547